MEQQEDDLAELAAQVRKVYWARCINFEVEQLGQSMRSQPPKMPWWDGGEDARGRRHKPIWPRIALRLLKAGMSAETAVEALFDGLQGVQAPKPDMLLQINRLRGAPERAAARTEAALRAIEVERKAAREELERYWSQWGRDAAQRMAVTTSHRELSPLFRMCLARQVGACDLEELYAQKAFVQYAQEPVAYDQALGDALPPEFRERLAALVNRKKEG